MVIYNVSINKNDVVTNKLFKTHESAEKYRLEKVTEDLMKYIKTGNFAAAKQELEGIEYIERDDYYIVDNYYSYIIEELELND